ncbi:restriction endonuclease [uncultured Roseobacter sp.]|uniref:restriction endonuclease n=1 Tax=uncultured Roseobacter sp. TaxID=114847 RepID=UPI0026308A97|nr:restriction endonuclease [uncultured Roseobacter sp.]
MSDFEDLEKLVAKIQSELAPTAEILHNQRIPGRLSGRTRQIDVLVKDRVGQYEILIVIDCKDYKKRADVRSVEEFQGLVADVGAHKGVLVCPSGFSEAAKTRASGLQMDLYSPVDTEPHKWTVNPLIPVVVDFRSAGISFGVSISGPYPFTMPLDMHLTKQVTDADGIGRGSIFLTAIEKWNSGSLPIEPGRHENLTVFEGETYMENGHGMIVPMEPLVSITVQRQLYYGLLPITKITGFKDEVGGSIITNGFDVGIVSPAEISSTWKEVESEEDCDQPATIKILGLTVWDEQEPNDKSVSCWNDQSEFAHLLWGGPKKYPSYEEVWGHPPSPVDALLGEGKMLERSPFGF